MNRLDQTPGGDAGAAMEPGKYLPEFLPADVVVITDFDEAAEALRHIKLYTAPLHDTQLPFSAHTLVTLNASEHLFRRRIMNRLVRPDALEQYRLAITLPALARQLDQVRTNRDGDGVCRTDLAKFAKLTFVHFAAAMIGLQVPSEEADIELAELLDGLLLGEHAYMLVGDWDSYVAQGRRAKEAFSRRYFDPALTKCLVNGADSPLDRASLISLVAAGADPAWQDRHMALREGIVLLLASVETSTNLITNAVDELSRWFIAHPEHAAMAQDLEFLGRAVQETLRLYPATPYRMRLAAIEDEQLSTSGRHIKKGQTVVTVVSLANRDPKVFGPDATRFNPFRQLPPSRPRYGVSFGAGQHQCLGLRVVLGNDGIGSHSYVLKILLAAGVRPDPNRRPEMEPSGRNAFRTYPVTFTTP